MERRAETGDAPQAPRREADLAARWAVGVWRGETLQAPSGARFRLIFEGRRNGGPGPDFRDAVLETEQGARLLGDIELHLRARDWLAHGHHTDTRYNRVILHVALDGASVSSLLASGKVAPVVSLSFTSTTTLAPMQPGWPCEGLRARVGEVALRATLLWAGLERFEQRVSAFGTAMIEVEDISSMPELPWAAADRILWVALAEALGYGRNRAALRQAGIQLLTDDPPDVMAARRGERARLRGLLTLWERWSATGPWAPLREALELRASAVVDALRAPGGAISPARARIMAANVVFPFAAAWAARTGDAAFVDLAHARYLELPGLPSNQITRAMGQQLGLVAPPAGAGAQQGLHHLWAGWCHAKACRRCPCNPHASTAPSVSSDLPLYPL
jgi:hypothetical protein